MRPPALIRAFVLALALLPAGAIHVSADDGRPNPGGRPSAPPETAGRPHQLPVAPAPVRLAEPTGSADGPPFPLPIRRPPPATLVILVGGYGTQQPDDPTFMDLAKRIEQQPGYHVERLGADPANPYDSYQHLDTSAEALIKEVRSKAASYPGGVHIISHSGGAGVVDRAFAKGLSAADGVRSFQAVAPPHNGSTVAWWTDLVLPSLGQATDYVRAILMSATPLPDPESDAMHDLAHLRRTAPPPGVVEVDYTLASDTFVMEQDNFHPGVPLRLYTPQDLHQLAIGHDSFVNTELSEDVVRAVRCSCVPPDRRTVGEVVLDEAIRQVSTPVGNKELALIILVALGLAAGFYLLRPETRQALDRAAKAYLRTRGR
ncbi:MAG: hypothetical protein E6H88_14755 [Chloroflexi bacterium]|nr:MAG: hypothetical protein E6H88_14755 [Chloroflexota bacterium]